MSDDRSIALTTACDDLQAQLEAGNRSVRLIDDDLTELGALLPSVFAQTAKLTGLLKHMGELRANMLEQRKALREVRAAAKALCAAVTTMTTLVEEQLELEEPSAPAARTAGLATDRTSRRD
ncbi:MAG TPA: hypothetical protein VIX63_10210 [Vicinamibacterales bacterium]